MSHYLLTYTLIILSLATPLWGSTSDYFELDLRTIENSPAEFPEWLDEVSEQGGEFNKTDGWTIDKNKPFGMGRLYLTLSTQALKNDLALTFVSQTASNIAVQLYDKEERILAVDLLAQRQNPGNNNSITTLLIPIEQYPQTHHIVLRRLEGPIAIQYISLFSVEQRLSPEEANIATLAKQFGDPLAPENPLLATLKKSTNNSSSHTEILETPEFPYRPLHTLANATQNKPINEKELLTILQILGLQGYDFNAFDFVKAAGEGRQEVVQLYLRAGMPIDARGDNKYTALAEAATSGELRVLQLLCDNGADPEIRTAGGNTALWMAALMSNFEAIRLLVENGSDVNAICVRRETPANILLQNRKRDSEKTLATFKYLLEHGTNPNILDARKRNLLHTAIEDGWSHEVTEILKYAPDLTAVDSRGFTPMMAVKYRKNTWMERALLNAGAEDWEPSFDNVNQRLVYHIHRREYSTALKLIKEEGANPNINDKDGNPIAFRIVRSEQIETLKSMMAVGLDIFVHGHGNKTLLTAPNSRPDKGKNAIVQFLLDQGLDPNYATPEGLKKKRPYWTPLMAAANSGNVERCRILLDAGADPTTKNLPRRTAAILAERGGYYQLAQELKQAEVIWTQKQK